MKNGEKNKQIPDSFKTNRVLEVCKLLNDEGARYLVVGGIACNLHGLIRATKDIDILIPRDVANTEKVLHALGHLTFGISRELEAETVTKKPFTIIGDTPRVDILTVAKRTRYEDATKTALKTTIDNIAIPYVDYETLKRTKDTDRLQDKADMERLAEIKKLIL